MLKLGGVTTHYFPSRYRLIEPHIRVPLAGFIQSPFWLKLWAFLGVRNIFQKGKTWREAYQGNSKYCKTGVHYLKYRDLKNIILSVFGNVSPMTKVYIKNETQGGAAKLGRMLPIPGYASLLFWFQSWNLFMKKEK